MTVKKPRFFAQIFGFRFLCPQCGELNTYARGRSKLGPKGFNRIAGICECRYCRKKYAVGLLLYAVDPHSWGKGGHPDQVPTLKELQAIREELDRQGMFIEKKKKRKESLNQYFEQEPTDEELDN